MQKHLLYINTLAISSVLAFTACTDEINNAPDPQTPDADRAAIELSVGGIDGNIENAATRASVITDEVSEKTFENFDQASKVFMVMKSDYVSLGTGYTDIDYKGATDTKYCVTRGEVAANQDKMIFETGNIRYWDDAHARSTKLSIWAFTAPGSTFNNCTFGTSDGIQGWKTTAINPVINTWKVSAYDYQNAAQFTNQNLCFSNNIVDYTTESKDDRRLGYDTAANPRHFEAGKLVFYHAMSKITIHIKKGTGYTAADPFEFATGTNVKLTNYNTQGTFDIAEGKFTNTTAGNITWIVQRTAETGDAYTLEALVVPGTTHSTAEGSIWKKDNTDTSMSIIIDGNLYNISQDALITALRQNSAVNGIAADATTVEMEAGKNYIFTFTIGKKQIDNLTAQVAEWEEVTADEFAPSNARIKIQVEERGTEQTSNLNIFRGLNTATTINDAWESYDWNTPTYENIGATYASSQWTSALFWESNKHFYHFRSLMPNTVALASDNKSVDLTSAVSYTDVLWGAPMIDDGNNETEGSFKWNYGPTENGFDGKDGATTHQIYKAIGPTNDRIKLIMFHMMSDLTIKLQTTTGTDAVDFGTGTGESVTKVELVDYKANGKLQLGNGLVTATGDAGVSVISNTVNSSSLTCTYGAIPQDLTNVKLRITTADGNQYIVNMGERVATAVPTETNLNNPYTLSNGTYAINRWYPGYKYIYTFTLKKTGITNITATIVNWETVTAAPDDVYIK